MISKSQQQYKIVLLGDGRVGKTSLIQRYVLQKFDEGQTPTFNASFHQKQVTLKNNTKVKVNIWDTAGQEQFNSVAPIYYRDANGAIIVYDINKPCSFNRMHKWIQELQEFSENKKIFMAIAANQADLINVHSIAQEQGQKVATNNHALFYLTSAKTGKNVDAIFNQLIENIDKNNKSKAKNSNTGKIQIYSLLEQNEKQKNKECC